MSARRPPRLLLFAYYYPPENTSGAARPARLARYLPEAGIECTVVACGRPPEALRLPHTTYVEPGDAPPLQRFLSQRIQRFLLPLNERLPWVPAAVCAGMNTVRDTQPDVILSTYPPLASHLAAWEVHRRTGLPWIADFRDPLAHNSSRRRAFGDYDQWLERRIFRAASLCLANTDGLLAHWEHNHPSFRQKCRVLWNGYDPESPVAPAPAPAPPPRLLLHAGALYGSRRPDNFLSALACLARQGGLDSTQWRIVLLGPAEPGVFQQSQSDRDYLESAGLLQIDARLASRDEARDLQTRADSLLIFDNNLLQESVQVPAKLFEYVRTGQPVIACTPEGSPTQRILDRSGIDFLCLPPNCSTETAASRLADFLRKPLERKPLSAWFEENFDGRRQAFSLAQDIYRLLGRNPPHALA